MWQNNNVNQQSELQLGTLLKGLVVSLTFSIILILFMAILIQYTTFRESNLPTGGVLIVLFSTVAGGLYAGKKAGSRGLWHGLGVGLCFAFVALMVSLCLYYNSLSWTGFLEKCIWSALGGTLGGVIGVGFRE